MSNPIQTKRNSTPNNPPSSSDILEGELAINFNGTSPPKLYTKDSGGVIKELTFDVSTLSTTAFQPYNHQVAATLVRELDSTPDHVLLVGAFGLGGTNTAGKQLCVEWTDANSIPATGMYHLAAASSNIPGGGAYAVNIFHVAGSGTTGSTTKTQFAYPIAAPSTSDNAVPKYRSFISSAWTAWESLVNQTQLALKAPLASPVFTGNPTAPTPATSDNDTTIATTAFVQNVLAGVPSVSSLFICREQANSGINGPAAAAATWNVRSLGTVIFDGIQDAVSGGSYVQLPPGKYLIEATAPAMDVLDHKAKLVSIAPAVADLLLGTSESTTPDGAAAVQSRSWITGVIELLVTTQVQIQHWTEGSGILGKATAITGYVEVYATMKITKIA